MKAGRGATELTECCVDIDAYILSERTILEIQQDLDSGLITSADLTQGYLDRIVAYDQRGPALRAVIEINPDAVALAARLDETRPDDAGPLYGIPVLVKDNISTADQPTTAGSVALAGAVPDNDAHVVRLMRDAGAVILGKANLHEFAFGISTVSSLGGQTLNPYGLTKNPAGSSGGSAVAVAADFAVFALGTDTGGSLRLPPSATNTVGVRTSTGLVSRGGVAPISTSRDSTGPITRYVEDAAVVLDVLVAGGDDSDPLSIDVSLVRPASYAAALAADALAGARIGVLTCFQGTTDAAVEVNDVMASAYNEMRASGAELVEFDTFDLGDKPIDPVIFEAQEGLDAWLMNFGDAPVSSMAELAHSEGVESGVRGIFETLVAQGRSVSDPVYISDVIERSTTYRAAVEAFLNEHDLDALTYPTSQEPPVDLDVQNWAASNADLSASTGLPAITVPAGFTIAGMPVGIEFLARPFAETRLLSIAYSYEQATRHRVTPELTGPITDARHQPDARGEATW